jgi:hypothetical protein
VRRVRKADNLVVIYEPVLNISQPYRPPRPVTGISLLFSFTFLPYLTSHERGNFQQKLSRSSEKGNIVTGYSILITTTEVHFNFIPPTALEMPW